MCTQSAAYIGQWCMCFWCECETCGNEEIMRNSSTIQPERMRRRSERMRVRVNLPSERRESAGISVSILQERCIGTVSDISVDTYQNVNIFDNTTIKQIYFERLCIRLYA